MLPFNCTCSFYIVGSVGGPNSLLMVSFTQLRKFNWHPLFVIVISTIVYVW